ncbi:MAG: hypothetical protein ACTSQU_05550 [Promethearchaeota archaeon]
MPENEEKAAEDFISLWKKKLATENTPSVIVEVQKENEQLRRKIAANIDLITKSEEILKKAVGEKEKLKIEKDEAVAEIAMQLNNLKQENSELGNKVKSMIKLLLEKDEEIKSKDNLILNFQSQATTQIGQGSMTENGIIEELKSEISKRDISIQNLERKTTELSNEIEQLTQNYEEELKSKPIDFVVQASASEQKVIKPMPPESSTQPLETLCQDLQSDLTKYKRIVENLKKEKNELKSALEGKGVNLTDNEFESLEKENELLKKQLAELQNSLKSSNKETPLINSEEYGQKIQNLENKVREKENIIADLKLSAISPTSDPSNSMAELVESLQKNINKLKITLSEKEKEITDLKVNLL